MSRHQTMLSAVHNRTLDLEIDTLRMILDRRRALNLQLVEVDASYAATCQRLVDLAYQAEIPVEEVIALNGLAVWFETWADNLRVRHLPNATITVAPEA